jgi:hypothetical protein
VTGSAQGSGDNGIVTRPVAPATAPVCVRLSDGSAAISALPITDNAASLTVDAPVGTPVFVRLSDGASAIATLPVSLAALPALVASTATIGNVGNVAINQTYTVTSAAAIAGGNAKIMFDLFNATGSGKKIKIRELRLICNMATVTGVPFVFSLNKTSAVGTGGTGETVRLMDTTNTVVPAQVTARSAPSGGATSNYVISYFGMHSEETNAAVPLLSRMNIVGDGTVSDGSQPLTIEENAGISIVCNTNSTAGSWYVFIRFTLE